MELNNKKAGAKMIFAVLEQFGDTSEDITSDFISQKIRETFNVDVDVEFIEHFMRGLSAKLISIMNMGVSVAIGGAMGAVMRSVAVKNFFLRNRKRALSILGKIKDVVFSKGKIKDVVDSAFMKGTGSNEIAIREVNDTMRSFMTYHNLGMVADKSLKATNLYSTDAYSIANDGTADSQFTGNDKILKAVLEFKATAKQGF